MTTGTSFDASNHDTTGSGFTLNGRTAPDPWAVAMADFALELHGSFTDFDAVIAAVAALAVKVLPGVTAAGVVRVGKDSVLTCQVATNPQVLQMIQAEQRTGQGPCRHVLEQAGPAMVLVGDLPGAGRWPQYTAEATSIGVAAVLAVRLDSGVGSADLVLMLVTDRKFDGSVVDGVDVFAAHAAVAAAQARVVADRAAAVHSRDVIGQAKGILMERYKISSSHAFTLLTTASQNTNTALRQVAGHIADTGEFVLPRQCSAALPTQA